MTKSPRLWSLVLASACCVGAAGCATSGGKADGGKRRTGADFANALSGDMKRSLTANPPPAVAALDVYQLTVPLGAVSRSQEFWKRVNETSVDVATCDLLQKNGFRVGVASA